MAKESQKRPLRFESLDDIIQEANQLLHTGYVSRGNWTLGQACFHLAEWTRFPMDGFPRPPFVLRLVFSAMKGLGIIKRMEATLLTEGFKAGTPTAPQTVVPSNEMTDQAGVDQLTEVIHRMKHFDGPLQPSPLFGVMDREVWTKVTLLHAAHHLAFLEPK
ncbi:DUF1569 domain-containing protein [Rubripirellula amarantea]|uniref:DinB superfamily protein n=1 Tax=Rubripirellula amarantea TaxID=2527999 RepID=A0A5C5WXM0_9BACT|nr:DUF1569 domain-containing protein [Rubripirellula amarantea]MDA8746255.1 DUF1569 domain-containing protein [Rubripirellula amarantea]TWT54871.1 hypothetical protein Pla22_25250 [Rubripirellula amarantea]